MYRVVPQSSPLARQSDYFLAKMGYLYRSIPRSCNALYIRGHDSRWQGNRVAMVAAELSVGRTCEKWDVPFSPQLASARQTSKSSGQDTFWTKIVSPSRCCAIAYSLLPQSVVATDNEPHTSSAYSQRPPPYPKINCPRYLVDLMPQLSLVLWIVR